MRELYILCFLITISCCCLAQPRFYNHRYVEGAITYELLAGTAGMNCLTDLGGKRSIGQPRWQDVNWQMTKPAVSFAGILTYCRNIALRFNFVSGSVMADDAVIGSGPSPAEGRYLRNLHFFSRILEGSVMAEIYPMTLFAREGEWLPAMSPYCTVGVGCFSFEPKAVMDGVIEKLRPLRTEGQGFAEYPSRPEYRNVQLNIAFGTGVKCEISPLINLRAEITIRKLFTDYLDDVSTDYVDPALYQRYHPPSKAVVASKYADRRKMQVGGSRGNSGKKDSYFTIGIAGSWVFGREMSR